MDQPEFKSFSCCICGIEINYDYHGRAPPYHPKIVFLEDGYFRRDPFSKAFRPLFLGSHCGICGREVCAATTCSFFFSKRCCRPCCQANITAFPPEVQRELKRTSGVDSEAA
ncbi:hypothetical protein CYMTET_42502 [Cymbomonas tetramitiformis]|uniref:Cysteine-rich DPF motif domain-containing protein 1 n=1 Tax=Cymbomonas tetramitiformis TaxID=36881 RepID=A0AAE0F168_9CHLO|nr:hypothetical protein CYMTET_42502 [Cymbomonas tetramitiformis]